MRQEGVRMASGRRQDNLASGWRQDDVKRRGARINYPAISYCLGISMQSLRRPTQRHLSQIFGPGLSPKKGPLP